MSRVKYKCDCLMIQYCSTKTYKSQFLIRESDIESRSHLVKHGSSVCSSERDWSVMPERSEGDDRCHAYALVVSAYLILARLVGSAAHQRVSVARMCHCKLQKNHIDSDSEIEFLPPARPCGISPRRLELNLTNRTAKRSRA
jgi:hypothetical protein